MLSKFGVEIDLDITKGVLSLKPKPGWISSSMPQFLANVNFRSRSLCRRPSVRLSVVCPLCIPFVRPTQGIEIFGNVSTPFGTLAICELSIKNLRRSSQGNPSVKGGGLHRRGGRI